MKKLAILAAVAVAALGLGSCSDDNTPQYQQPAEGSFVLNIPPMANQTYDLESCGPVVLTTSQPDYGFTASVTYGIQVAIVENPKEDEIYSISTLTPTSAVLSIDPVDLATAICTLSGIKNEEDWANNPLTVMPVYLRATAQLGTPGQYPHTEVVSNWVTLANVVPFFAVPQPGVIYLIGNPGNWTSPEANHKEDLKPWRLLEPGDDIGCKIYSQIFDLAEGDLYFRFYTKLEGWDSNSLGPDESAGYDKKEDNGAWNVFFENNNFVTPFSLGLNKECKNNFVFLGFEGGKVKMTVNLAGDVPTVTIEKVEE